MIADGTTHLEPAHTPQALRALVLPPADMVVGIATGGIVPGSLVAAWLALPLRVVELNYRAPDSLPQRPRPELMRPLRLEDSQLVLLVDDVSVTGQTLAVARGLLEGHTVYTLALKGRADFVLFPDIHTCLELPWRDF